MVRSEYEFLSPLTGERYPHGIVVFDVESKDGDKHLDGCQDKNCEGCAAGFTRPFLVGFHDGEKYRGFRDDEQSRTRPWQERAIAPGGCIDRFLTWLFFTPEGRNLRIGRPNGSVIYAHNGGNFDSLFILPWLRLHSNVLNFEILPLQSTVVEIKVHKIFCPTVKTLRSWLTKYAEGMSVNRTLGIKESTDLSQLSEIWKSAPEQARRLYKEHLKSENNVAKRKWCIRDSFRLVPTSLDELTKTFHTRRKMTAFDLNTPELSPEWERYNEADCIGLLEGMTKFHEIVEEKLDGDVKATAPGTAMSIFRRKYLKSKIPRHAHWNNCPTEARTKRQEDNPCQECLHDWIRRSVAGGRTEIFRTQGENLRYYDINSSYAAAMLEPMPVGNLDEQRGNGKFEIINHLPPRGSHLSICRDKKCTGCAPCCPGDDCPGCGPDASVDFHQYQRWSGGKPEGAPIDLRKSHIGFVECWVFIPADCEVPPLPVHEGGKLIFRCGTMKGVWTWKELELLAHPRVRGRILRIERSVWYEASPIFAEMMNDLYYGYRDKSRPDYSEGLSTTAKRMANSVFGKTIMKPDRLKVFLRRLTDEVPKHAKHARVAERCKVCKDEGVVDGRSCEACEKNRQARTKKLERLPHLARIPGAEDSAGGEGKELVSEVYYLPTRVRAAYIIPQIGSYITSLGRIKLWHYMVQVLDLGGTLCYLDTDSCLCWLPPGKELPTSSKLGHMKAEYPDRRLKGTFFLPKMYVLEDMDGRLFPKQHEEECMEAHLRRKHCTGCHDKHCRGCRPAHLPDCKDKECLGCKPSHCESCDSAHLPQCKDKKCTGCGDKCLGCKDLVPDSQAPGTFLGKCIGCSNRIVTAKGIPSDRKTVATIETLVGFELEDWTSENLFKEHEDEGGVIEFQRLQKFGRMAQNGFRTMPGLETVTKSMRTYYNKRLVYSDGSTAPHSLVDYDLLAKFPPGPSDPVEVSELQREGARDATARRKPRKKVAA
jgi:hypothetical protein